MNEEILDPRPSGRVRELSSTVFVGIIVCHKESRSVLLLKRGAREAGCAPVDSPGVYTFPCNSLLSETTLKRRLQDAVCQNLACTPQHLHDPDLLEIVDHCPVEGKQIATIFYLMRVDTKFEPQLVFPEYFDEAKWTHIDNIRNMLDGQSSKWGPGVKEMLLEKYNVINKYIKVI